MIPDKTTIVLLAALVLASGILIPITSAVENITRGENQTTDLLAPGILPEGDENSTGLDDNGKNGSENLTFSKSGLSPVNTTKPEPEYQSIVYAAGSPVADFNATPISGPAPLSVQFTDTSTGSPTSWSWNFGDEWWNARRYPGGVVMPDGTILVMGGAGDKDFSDDPSYQSLNWRLYNDTWKSTDYGATWTLVNGSSGWTARRAASVAVLPDGTIVLIGGHDYLGYKNDVWHSTDQGATWTCVNSNGGWTLREGMAITVLSDGSIIISGGTLANGMNHFNDVWRSSDKGVTWTRVIEHAAWVQRFGHTMTTLPDHSVILTGGYIFGGGYPRDMWRSTDYGTSWTQVSAKNVLGRYLRSSAVLPDGSIVLSGGSEGASYYKDIWRSADNGTTWSLVNWNCSWSKRNAHSSVVTPDGSIVLMGGSDDQSGGYMSDVWRSTDSGVSWTFMGQAPANSPDQNPLHNYTKPGIYTVSMKATNVFGSNREVKVGYVTVGEPVLEAKFSATPITGTVPLVVTFTDLSTGSPTSWSWDFGDGNTSTEQNPVHTYYTYGTHPVNLTISDGSGSNFTEKPAYIFGTGGTYLVFVEGVGDYPGTANDLTDTVPLAQNFYTEIQGSSGDTTWTGYDEHYNESAGSKFWSVSEPSAIKADYADFALFAGHGNQLEIDFGTNNSFQELYANDMEFGNTKAKWVTFASCLVLNRSDWTNMKPVFKGLHILNGYDTEGFPYREQGTQFAERMKGENPYPVQNIRDAWMLTLMDTINVANKEKYYGAWMWADPCGEDYLPGYGKFCHAPSMTEGEYDIQYLLFNLVTGSE